MTQFLRSRNLSFAFPDLVIDNIISQGFDEKTIEKTLRF